MITQSERILSLCDRLNALSAQVVDLKRHAQNELQYVPRPYPDVASLLAEIERDLLNVEDSLAARAGAMLLQERRRA